MRRLSAYDIVRLCEWGRDKHPLDRALALVRAAEPALTAPEAARLPIGTRDALLIRLRQQTFGDGIDVQAGCPGCGTAVEFSVTAAELLVDPPDGTPGERALVQAGRAVPYRLPDSHDLAAAAEQNDLAAARARLLERCIGTSEPLDDDTREALARAIAEADPQADLTFRMTCACGETWRVIFDICVYFWAELEAQYRQLLREVDALARAYGWPEPYILTMTAHRRARYLEMRGDS